MGRRATPAVVRTFDMDGRIKRVPLSPAATHTVGYDLAGNITSLADTGLAVRSVTYDALDQVLGTHLGAAGYENYLYDANGNRTSGPLAANTLAVDPASDKLLSLKTNNVVKKAYTYDASGNLTSDGVQNFEYSTRNRLWAVWHGANWVAHFYSGGEDVLRQYLPANNTTATLYDDAGHIVGEYAAALITAKAHMTWEHIYLGDIPVGAVRGAEITSGAAVTPDQVYRVYSDHLDTPRNLVKSDGVTVAWSWNPKLFGNTAPSDPNGLKYNLRFPGQIYDAFSGFNINGFRLYDPATGRYTQPDPIGLAGGQNNLYTYVGGNPVAQIDILGLCAGDREKCINHFLREKYGDFVADWLVPKFSLRSFLPKNINSNQAWGSAAESVGLKGSIYLGIGGLGNYIEGQGYKTLSKPISNFGMVGGIFARSELSAKLITRGAYIRAGAGFLAEGVVILGTGASVFATTADFIAFYKCLDEEL